VNEWRQQMVTIDTKHQKRKESNNMSLGKIESKHLETRGTPSDNVA
jgi:hypothetical protein